MRVDETCGFFVYKDDSLICGVVGWQLGEIGLRVGYNPCMSSGSGIADTTDLQATGDNIENFFWSRFS